MRVRLKENHAEGISESFNTYGVGEVLVYFEDCLDSVLISDLDVKVDDQWVDMDTAFKKKLIIPDNYNYYFGTPHSKREFDQGYNEH